MADGVTTIEIKSGYGLDGPTERRQLEAADLASRTQGFKVVKTFLGAHAVPKEYAGRTDECAASCAITPAAPARFRTGWGGGGSQRGEDRGPPGEAGKYHQRRG